MQMQQKLSPTYHYNQPTNHQSTHCSLSPISFVGPSEAAPFCPNANIKLPLIITHPTVTSLAVTASHSNQRYKADFSTLFSQRGTLNNTGVKGETIVLKLIQKFRFDRFLK